MKELLLKKCQNLGGTSMIETKQDIMGALTPQTPVTIKEIDENKYKLQFSWGETRQITLAVPGSTRILCNFLRDMRIYTSDFEKETEFFFKRDEEGRGFVFNFSMNNKGETIVKLTYNQLKKGKPQKGSITKQGTDLYALYIDILTRKNIKIPTSPSAHKVFNEYFNGETNFMTPEVIGYEEKGFGEEVLLIEKSTGDFLDHTLWGCSVLIRNKKTNQTQKIELSKCLFSEKELDKYVKSITPKMVKRARRYGETKVI